VPVIGFATIQAMRVAGATVLSIDAGRTLMLDHDAVLASANEGKIAMSAGPCRNDQGLFITKTRRTRSARISFVFLYGEYADPRDLRDLRDFVSTRRL